MKHLILVIFMLSVANSVLAGDAEAGKEKSGTCAACHGSEGISAAPMWPNLAGQHATYTAKQLKEFRDGKRQAPAMAPMAMGLSDEDMADLAAYYASLPAQESVGVDEKFVALGEEVYTRGAEGVMACTACHGPTGKGIEAAGFPSITGQKIDYTIKTLKDFRSGYRNNDMNGMMRDIAKAMTDEQIEAVANYLTGLH